MILRLVAVKDLSWASRREVDNCKGSTTKRNKLYKKWSLLKTHLSDSEMLAQDLQWSCVSKHVRSTSVILNLLSIQQHQLRQVGMRSEKGKA